MREKKTSRSRTRSKPLKKGLPARGSRQRAPQGPETALARVAPPTNLADATTVRPVSADPARTSVIAQKPPKPPSALKNASIGVLVVIVLAVLVLGALALPQYPTTHAGAPAIVMRQSDVHLLPQSAAVAQSDVPPATTIPTPIPVGPATDKLAISQVKAQREVSGKTNKASDGAAGRTSPNESTALLPTLLPVAAADGGGETAGLAASTATTSTAAATSTSTGTTRPDACQHYWLP